jgi:serine/threonine protein kinase
MAPEILSDKAYEKCVDIWATGIIMFYMLFGDYPFKGLNILNDIETKCSEGYDLLREINPQIIRKRNKSLRDKELNVLRHFFANVFVIDPRKRMSILDMSRHPIFKECQVSLDHDNESINESSESMEEQRMFSIKKTEFIEEVFNTIRDKGFLTAENTLLMRYFVNKISLCTLNVAMKDIDFTEDKTFKTLYSKNIDKIF